MIREIQLIHHTHADFGYTDLPSTSFAYLSRYLGEAVRIARETADFPEAARFHYTCEIGYVVEDFLATATPDERAAFDRLVAAGQFEVGAMPFHITALLDADEWRAQLDRSQPLFDRYRPRTCFQNDINGLPWGIIPALCDRGVRHVMMGINTYSGGVPRKPPCGFWWEGPDGRRLLAWISLHYCAGYNLFYDGEWRTGPVPAYPDVWFHPPVGRQIFDDSPQALAAAHAHLLEKLAADFADYPHSVLGVQVTNMWRMDNDPPCEQLCHFVRAWNEAGLQPALRLSTPTRFLDAIQREAGDSLPVARGDWGEWWADGPASMPAETALSQRTKRLLAELPAGAEALGAPSPDPARLAAIWRMAGLYTEHTFCSWHSLAQPSHPLTLGSLAQKANFAYQPDVDARTLRAEVLRAAPAYRPSSLTRHLTVLNPGRHPRADWVEIPAAALRQPANAVRDPLTGEVFVFEEVTGPYWSEPDADRPRPFEVPDDIFSFRTETLRFFCPPLAPGASRRFELVELSPSDNSASASRSSNCRRASAPARNCSTASPANAAWKARAWSARNRCRCRTATVCEPSGNTRTATASSRHGTSRTPSRASNSAPPSGCAKSPPRRRSIWRSHSICPEPPPPIARSAIRRGPATTNSPTPAANTNASARASSL